MERIDKLVDRLLADYVGKKIAITVEHGSWVSSSGRLFEFSNHKLVKDDPTVNEMLAILEEAGMTPRIIFPGTVITADVRFDRYNIHIVPLTPTEAVISRVGIG